jgi:hypothetical protein
MRKVTFIAGTSILEFFLNKDITDTAMSASYLDLQLDID